MCRANTPAAQRATALFRTLPHWLISSVPREINGIILDTGIIEGALLLFAVAPHSSFFPHRDLQASGAERLSPPLPCRIRRAARPTPASTGSRLSDTRSCAAVLKKYVGSKLSATSSPFSCRRKHTTKTRTKAYAHNHVYIYIYI